LACLWGAFGRRGERETNERDQASVTCAESSCTTLGLAAAVGGIGAAGGAGVGALVGLAIPSWKLRFP